MLSVIEMLPTALASTTASSLTLASGPDMLLSIWKPLVALAPFIVWLWIISRVCDKHAARFFLAREMWNNIHLGAGVVALGVLVLNPVAGIGGFIVGLLGSIVVLAASIGAYMVSSSKDERVPEAHRLTVAKLFNPAAQGGPKKAKKGAKSATSSLVIKGPDKQALPVPAPETPELEVRMAAEKIILDALTARATTIDLQQISKEQFGVKYTVDGVDQGAQTLPAAQAVAVFDLLKTAAKQDITDRRRRQVSDILVERGEEKAKRLRVATWGGQSGLRLSVTIDPEGQVRRTPEDLGMLDNQLEELRKLIADPAGLVLLAGQPKNGRTTTMYSVVKMHDAYTSNVQTIELEVQDAIEGTRQNKWDPQAEGPDHATLLRSIIRRDPNVVAVAELVDQATAKELVRADPERVRTYLSLKTDNALAAIQLWVKAVGDPAEAAKVLHGVVAQKLYRKLCTNCRVPYTPAPDMLKKLGLPADKVKQLFKKGGQVMVKDKSQTCPVCQGSGFLQQGAVWEIYPIGAEERELIAAQNWEGLRTAFRKTSLPAIGSTAIRRVAEGLTSIEEVQRISGGEGQAAKPAAPKPAAPAAQ